MSKKSSTIASADPLTAASSIGQLLRAQFALHNNLAEEKPKTVGFNEAENMRLYELYSAKREEYHSTRPSGQRNEEVPMDILAREWAQEITSMGFAERTPAQIKQRIRDMRKFSRKHAHKLGITTLNNTQPAQFKVEQRGGGGGGGSAEFSWAETKRRSRGPVPDWMSGLAQIMMTEQEKQQEEHDTTTDVMDAAFSAKAKRMRLEKQEQQMKSLQVQIELERAAQQHAEQQERLKREREMREMSPETALIEKKLQLADAKLESERLRQQALRLEIAYYQRQVHLYDEQLLNSTSEVTSIESPNDFLNMKLNEIAKSELGPS